ncbi:MAG: DUF481 domain-containing protein [Candidatus Synoicihabitans palmerolidicus]|nr:DUF481 domain-containing protein [Candidatus Synoicihabitans palmerolidicus]
MFTKIVTVLVTTSLTCAALSADVAVTKDGARLIGTVKKVDDGKVVLGTSYAGDVSIKQSEVESLTVVKPLVVRLEGGTTMQGTVTTSASGQIAIAGKNGTISTTVDKIATTWSTGGADPAIAARQRKWAYETSLDIRGKNGKREQLGTTAALKAVLKGNKDKLQFLVSYNRQENNGTKSVDKFRAEVDYTNNFKGQMSWYMRNEGGFDRVKDIGHYNVSAVGVAYDFIKNSTQRLTGRSGILFRYENYKKSLLPDMKSVRLEYGLKHTYQWKTMKLSNSLKVVPLLDDLANYRVVHDSFFEMPSKTAKWTLHVGLLNDYASKPVRSTKGMNTTYYTRVVLKWD